MRSAPARPEHPRPPEATIGSAPVAEAELATRSARAHMLERSPAARVRSAPLLVEAETGPLSLETALAAISHQGELAAPAKVVLSAQGEPGLLAEVPADGDPEEARRQAAAALEAAVAWLGGKVQHSSRCGGWEETPARIEAALSALGWLWEPTGGGRYRADPRSDGVPARLLVASLAGGSVCVALPPTALRAAAVEAARAVRLFALEANARLRLARLAVVVGTGSTIQIGRDTVLPPGTRLERWLGEVIGALAVAHAETGRALRALGAPAVASAYLESRAQLR